MSLGIDISYWQSDIDFAAARSQSGVEWVACKAGGSNSGRYTDSKYRRHVQRARAAGLPIGHYWFNGEGDPTEDADYFVNNLEGFAAGDVLVLDIENEGSMPAWGPAAAYAFCARVKERTGIVPMLYMSSSVTRQAWNDVVNLGAKLWVAQYNSSGTADNPPTNLGPWGNGWTIWQYSSSGSIAGYGSRVDVNVAAVPFTTIHGGAAPTPATPESDEDMQLYVRQSFSDQPRFGDVFVVTANGPLRYVNAIEWGAINSPDTKGTKPTPAQWGFKNIQDLVSKQGCYAGGKTGPTDYTRVLFTLEAK